MRRFVWTMVLSLFLFAGCSSDLLRYRTKMWHQCQTDLNAEKLRSRRLAAARKREQARVREVAGRLKACKRQTGVLTAKIAGLTKQLERRKAAIAELERRAARIRARSEMYEKLASRLRKMIDAGNLKVTIRKGRMILNLPNEILFDPGRAKLKEAGKQALAALAEVLKDFGDREFLVAGHTDNVPVRHSRYHSNWELSVARALRVVEFLQASGMDPRHLAAAGFSEFDPVADNATDAGRAKNRRIEIVVMPNVSELPQVPLSNGSGAGPGPSAAGRPSPPQGPARPARRAGSAGAAPAERPTRPARPGEQRGGSDRTGAR